MSLTPRAGQDGLARVRALGHGPRRGLMLHCSLAHGGAWRGLAGAFEAEFTFAAPDLPSHGRSAVWDRQGSYHDACTAAAAAHLTAQPNDQPIDIVGHSFGATVALRLAVERPDRVRSLVLIEPVLFAVAVADDPNFVSNMNGLRDILAREGRRAATKAFLQEWGGGLPWEKMPEATRADMAGRIEVIPDAAPALYQDEAGLLAEGRLQALDMPFLLIRGAASPAVVETIHSGLIRRIPGAEGAVIAGAGHMLPISHPKDCAAVMGRFWGL